MVFGIILAVIGIVLVAALLVNVRTRGAARSYRGGRPRRYSGGGSAAAWGRWQLVGRLTAAETAAPAAVTTEATPAAAGRPAGAADRPAAAGAADAAEAADTGQLSSPRGKPHPDRGARADHGLRGRTPGTAASSTRARPFHVGRADARLGRPGYAIVEQLSCGPPEGWKPHEVG